MPQRMLRAAQVRLRRTRSQQAVRAAFTWSRGQSHADVIGAVQQSFGQCQKGQPAAATRGECATSGRCSCARQCAGSHLRHPLTDIVLERSPSCHGDHGAPPTTSRRAQPQADAAPYQRERGGGRRRLGGFVGRRSAAPPGVPGQARRGAQVGRGRHRARLRMTLVRPGERPDSALTAAARPAWCGTAGRRARLRNFPGDVPTDRPRGARARRCGVQHS
jgi:hypothetical protein